MSVTFYGPDGQVESALGPQQYTAGGRPTGLPPLAKTLADWGCGASLHLRMYRDQPWVRICVDKLTFQVSRLPLKAYQGDPLNKKRLPDDAPLVQLLKHPAPKAGAIQLKQWMIKPVLIHGVSALRIARDRAGGTPVGFRRLLWQWLDPRSISGVPGEIDYWEYRPPNQRKPDILLPSDVFLIAWESADGTVGESPMTPLEQTLRIEYAARRYQEQLLRRGIRPPGGVSWGDSDRIVELFQQHPDLRKRFEDELAYSLAGADAAGQPISLPPGAKWQSFAYNANEAELVAHRKLGRDEVASAYDIKGPSIGIFEDVKGAVADIFPDLFQTTLPPWLSLIQDSFGAQIIEPEPRFAGQWVEHELGDVLRGDPVKESVALKTLVLTGLMKINEARAKLNLPRIDHPDAERVMFASNNMIFLGGTPLRDTASEQARAEAVAIVDQLLEGNGDGPPAEAVARLAALITNPGAD